jgi:S1-C subfamily serine protease
VQLPGSASQSGTGIVLTDSGELLTNTHVINGAVGISATDVGNGETYTAQIIGTDQSEDLAVLQLVGADGLQTAALGDSDSVFPGEGVVAVGNAHGVGGMPSYAGGSVTALQRHILEEDDADGWSVALDGLIETNAQILPGDSGGPLVDGNGDVVGVDTAILDSAPGGFAIPIDEALEVADEIVDQAG